MLKKKSILYQCLFTTRWCFSLDTGNCIARRPPRSGTEILISLLGILKNKKIITIIITSHGLILKKAKKWWPSTKSAHVRRQSLPVWPPMTSDLYVPRFTFYNLYTVGQNSWTPDPNDWIAHVMPFFLVGHSMFELGERVNAHLPIHCIWYSLTLPSGQPGFFVPKHLGGGGGGDLD